MGRGRVKIGLWGNVGTLGMNNPWKNETRMGSLLI